MASEKQDSTSFRAFIEAKIAKWQAVLDALAIALETDAADFGAVSASSSTADIGHPIDLPKGAFYGKSVPVCVELYLSAGKVKRTNKEIAAALKKGGVESNAKDFDTVVNGALFGLKKAGKVLRFDDGWGLSEWYPAHIRSVTPVAASGSKKNTKKGKKKPPRKAAAAKPAVVPIAKPSTVSSPKPAGDRIYELLRSKPGTDYELDKISAHLGMGTKVTRLIIGKLVKAGKAVKTAQDVYRSA
jgi:hypothetical protein